MALILTILLGAMATPAPTAAPPQSVAISTATAGAELASTQPRPRNDLRLDVGLGSPVGEVGVAMTRRLTERFAVEGGAGYGFSGLQLSLLPKVRLHGTRFVLTLGAGPSVSLPLNAPAGVTRLVWLNGEVGMELRSATSWFVAFGGGVELGLSGHRERFLCLSFFGDCSPQDIRGLLAPAVRVGVGRDF